MIPYFQVPSLGPIHLFGVLVATAILVGARYVKVRARQLGLDEVEAISATTWTVVGGFIVAHLFDIVAYQPGRLLEPTRLFAPGTWHFEPSGLALILDFRTGLSSFGGFAGSLIGLLVWVHKFKKPIFPFADSIGFGLVHGWVFGRLGCFSAHDHPGRHTDFFLAVKYPDGPRFDLGLLEALFVACLATVFSLLARKPRPTGLYITVACLAYAPVRFFMDFLRATDLAGADARYFGLTPAQYACILTFLAGILLAWRTATYQAPPQASEILETVPATGNKRRSGKRQKQPARG